MAYRIMSKLIDNYEKGSFTKDKLADMCDTYYGSGRLTDAEYTELMEKISGLADAQAQEIKAELDK